MEVMKNPFEAYRIHTVETRWFPKYLCDDTEIVNDCSLMWMDRSDDVQELYLAF